MPRGKRIPREGPFLENGSYRHPRPAVNPEDLKRQRKQLKEEARILKAQEIVESRVLPKRLKRMKASNSASINVRQSEWLDHHPYVLMAFIQKMAKEKLERQKKIARQGGHIRRLRILENGYAYYSVIQVLTTYGKDCYGCHTPIDLKASRRVGVGDWYLGLHIDHLIPIAKGGSDTLENVRPSHAICNLKKGVRLL